MSRSSAFGGGFIDFLIINTFNLDILCNRFLNDDFACSLFALCKLSLFWFLTFTCRRFWSLFLPWWEFLHCDMNNTGGVDSTDDGVRWCTSLIKFYKGRCSYSWPCPVAPHINIKTSLINENAVFFRNLCLNPSTSWTIHISFVGYRLSFLFLLQKLASSRW